MGICKQQSKCFSCEEFYIGCNTEKYIMLSTYGGIKLNDFGLTDNTKIFTKSKLENEIFDIVNEKENWLYG